MGDRLIKCAKCDTAMDTGFLLDRSESFNIQSAWVPGPPTKNFWTKLKIKEEDKVPITVYRCAKCGYLELYALKPTV